MTNGKEADERFRMQTSATAQFGDPRWLRFMLAPLSAELARIFTHQDAEAIERTASAMPMRDRKRFIAAIGRLTDVFVATGFDGTVVSHFLELSLALIELDHGVVRHFLKPTKASNRTHDPGDIWAARAMVAIALDVVANDPAPGASVAEASRQIAKHFGYLAHILSPQTDDFAGLIRSWRRQFLQRKISDVRAQSMFDNRAELVAAHIAKMTASGEILSGAALSAAIVREAGLFAIHAADHEAILRLFPTKPKRRKKPGS